MTGSYSDKNLWHSTANQALVTPTLNQDLTVDTVVIGGGFTGSTCALKLAEKGNRVVLLEANIIGHGGAGRNAGLVNAGLWVEPEKVEASLGIEAGRKLNEALQQGPANVFAMIDQYSIACEPTYSGTLHCAHSNAGLANLRERLRQYHARGINAELLSRQDTESKTGSAAFYGSIWHHGVGTIQPLAYVRGIAHAAVAAGATIYQHTPVTTLSRKNNNWEIQAGNYTIKAQAVVLATNAYHQGLHTQAAPAYTLMHYFQVATKPLSETLLQRILPERQGCWDTALILSSIRRDAAGRLILGAVGSLEKPTGAVHRYWAQHKLHALYPYLGATEFEYSWYGRIALTADHLPRIVSFGPNALSIFGYGGRGISPGTVFGTATAEYLLTGDEEVLPLKPINSYNETLSTLKHAYYEFGATIIHGLEGMLPK